MTATFSGLASGKVRVFPPDRLCAAHAWQFSPRQFQRSAISIHVSCFRALNQCSLVADIVKMIDSQPELASVIRRVRGGYLKIQGTWMPYEVSTG